MKTIEASKTLVTLILEHQSNIEYFISETLGYISDERAKRLSRVSVKTEGVVQIELSDEICDELRANFDRSIPLPQVVDIVLLCGYVFGGV